jgi:TRAP-type C4-dicarboxylate transport system permease small subunit
MGKVIAALELFNNACAAVVKVVVSIAVAAQIVIIFCGVLWRYFLRSPLTWTDEFATLLLVIIAFLGCYLALSQNKLARIELFISRFKGNAHTAIYIISELFSIAILVFVVYFGFRLFLMPTSLGQKTPGVGIPLWIFYGLIPLMFGLCLIKTLTKILQLLADGSPDAENAGAAPEGEKSWQ